MLQLEKLEPHKLRFRTIARCAGLLHDLGNPPYGHYGEDVIKAFFKEKKENKTLKLSDELYEYYGFDKGRDVSDIIDEGEERYSDFTRFNGNAQTLRILTSLSAVEGKPETYNLTAAVLGAIIKYPYYSSEKEKFNIFRSEKYIADWLIQKGTLIMGETNTFACIMEAADDIAYTLSDIDDAVKKKLITEADFKRELEEEIHHKTENENELVTFQKDFVDYLGKNIDNPDPFPAAIQECLNTYRGYAIDCCARKAAKFLKNRLESDNLLTNIDKPLLPLECPVSNGKYWKTVDLLFEFLGNLMKKYVYVARPIVSNELEGENIMKYLLQELTSAVLTVNIDDKGNAVPFPKKENDKGYDRKKYFHYEKVYSLISDHIRKAFADKMKKQKDKKDEKNREEVIITNNDLVYYRLQMVTDYISGMTDSYAKIIYKELKAID